MQVLLREEELGVKPCWGKIFRNENPLYVEIGVGNGEFIVYLAKNNPDKNFLGIEVSREVLRKALKRAMMARIENLKLIWIEGTKALAKLFDTETIAGVYINFPDPWEKKKQKSRRLINTGLAWILADRLKLEGFFRVVTDHEEYAREILAIFEKNEAFCPLYDSPIATHVDNFYPTKYARKWISAGKGLYFIGFKKTKSITLPKWVEDWCPVLKLGKEDILPIVNLLRIREDLNFKILGEFLKNQIFRYGENITIKVLGVFYKEDGLLLDTIVSEGCIKQRFFVYIGKHQRDKIILKTHDSDKPDPTDGVHLAFVSLIKRIKERFPETEILKTTCKEKFLRTTMFEEPKYAL